MAIGASVRSILTALAVSALLERAAAADERERCAAAAERAQQSRDDGKYRAARDQMLFCARDVCPGPIRRDCAAWLAELDRDAPTVVIGARDRSGNDLTNVKVSLDQNVILTRLDGRPILVDSGEHRLTFETGGRVVKEERVLIRAAEKARAIVVVLPVGEAPSSGRSLAPTIIAGSIGVLALGSFATFGLIGKSEADDLQKCKPNCAESDADAARTKLIVADVSLAVGVVALGVAAYMFFTSPKSSASVSIARAWPGGVGVSF